jgi:hypothetical protein
MLNNKTKLALWFAALTFIMACAPVLTSAPPSAPTIDPNAVNRIIEQTANAASAQTAAALPTATGTETPTRIPTNTETEDPTATNTVIFEFHTSTPFVVPPVAATFNPTSKKDYACEVLNSPTDGTIYSPRLEFKVRWRLKNVGQKNWDGNSVDFVYDTGDKFHKVKGYDLGSEEIKIGEVAELFVEMQAPKDPGTYTTYWALRIGDEKFCKVSLTIGVK